MNQLIEPRAYRLFDEKPNNDVEGSKVRLRKMIREYDALLDFRQPLKALGFKTRLVPAMRILNDIYTHQQLFKEGGNELVEIGINGWSTTYRNSVRRELWTRLKAAGCIECDEISLNGNYGSKAFYYKFDQGFYDGAVLRVANQKPYLKKLAKKARKLKEGDTLIEPSFKRQLEANLRELQVDMTEFSRLYELYQNNASFVKKLFWSFKPFQDDYTQVYQQKNRIFTPVVNLPSGFRSLISHKKNKRLIKVDIVTCHATFLSSLYKGESKEERKEAKYFGNVLRNDFYERIRERIPERIRPSNRSDVKEMFNSSLNNKEWGRDKVRISKFNIVNQKFLRMFRSFSNVSKNLSVHIEMK